MWPSSLLPALSLLVVGVPTQLAKAAPTPCSMDLHITPRAPPLPELPTAYIDRSSLTVKDGGVLVHYISNNVDFFTATQAIIVIHGRLRDAANYFAGMQAAVDTANKSNIVIMAPVFFNGTDKGAFPWEDGTATSNQLVWKGDEWYEAGNNLYPTSISDISSFDALDAAIAYITDKKRFPVIEHVVLAGHSAGGQTVQRYAILSDGPPQGVSLRYIIANAGTYAYFSPGRFKPVQDDCETTFNNWEYSLDNYQFTYHADVLSTDASRVQMRTRYFTREIRYLYGTADFDAVDKSCQARAQGVHRFERGQLFWKHITETYPGPWIDNIQKVAFVEGVAHDAPAMWKSKEGQAALFSL